MQVQSLGQEDALEEEMANYSNILSGKIPWTEEPGGIQPIGLQRVGHDWVSEHMCAPLNGCCQGLYPQRDEGWGILVSFCLYVRHAMISKWVWPRSLSNYCLCTGTWIL